MTDPKPDDLAIKLGAIVALASIVTGLVVGSIWPGPETGVILPIGLTQWWLLYRFILWTEKTQSESQS